MLPVDQRKDWIKSRRRKRKVSRDARLRRQFFRMILLLSILALGFLGFTYLPWSLNNGESEIIVKGNHFTSSEQVRKTLSDSLYTPVYSLDPKLQEQKVEALESIKNAFVRRYAFPRPHVVVEVLEERPWASFGFDPAQPTHAVIAESGRIIPLKKFPKFISPSLKIYGLSTLKMTQSDVKQWATWVNFIQDQTGDKIQFVDMRKPFDVTAQTTQLSLKLGIPDTTLTHRIGRLTSILPTLKQYKENLEYVDLALDNNIPLKVSKKPLENKAMGSPSAQDEEAPPAVSVTSTPM